MFSESYGSISGYIKISKGSVCHPLFKVDNKQKIVFVGASFPGGKERGGVNGRIH